MRTSLVATALPSADRTALELPAGAGRLDADAAPPARRADGTPVTAALARPAPPGRTPAAPAAGPRVPAGPPGRAAGPPARSLALPDEPDEPDEPGVAQAPSRARAA
ncbi:hypothetical protein [Streptomyces sp. NPDC101237]|uniref:hypothetical protein n=1 Tax=Streptomyces sp. NPDC101237 TaxID=3366139 RepID=UPI0038304701